MADEFTQGRLAEAENERVFRTEILPDYLPVGMGSSDRPTLIVVAGQPGAGAAGVVTESQSELERFGPTVRIVGDDLRAHHPDFATYQRRDADKAWEMTRRDADIWSAKLLAVATERGVNIVYETTPRTTEDMLIPIRHGRDAGYVVDVRAVASNPRLSWQGSHSRFEELQLAASPAPLPSRTIHDEAVAAVAESLNRIERQRLADAVGVRLRDGSAVYNNSLAGGQWQSPPAASLALAQVRERPLSRDEMARFAETWSNVMARMEARGARADEVDAVRVQSRQDLAYFVAERRNGEPADAEAIRHSIMQRRPAGHEPGETAQKHSEASPDRGRRERANQLGPTGDLQRGEGRRQIDEGEIIVPARALPALTEAEIGEKLGRSQRLADKRAEIDRLSMLVYGHAGAVSATLRGIDGASSGAVAAEDVRSGKQGPLAGEDKGFLRAESPQRQAAKAHLPQLAAAMEDYGHAVAFERDRIDMQHSDQQRRQQHEIRTPSPGLTAVLRLPHQEQANRLNTTPELRHELDRFSASLNRRLSVAERGAARAGDANSLARSLAIPQERATALTRLYSQAQAAQQRSLAQRQQLARMQDSRVIKR